MLQLRYQKLISDIAGFTYFFIPCDIWNRDIINKELPFIENSFAPNTALKMF